MSRSRRSTRDRRRGDARRRRRGERDRLRRGWQSAAAFQVGRASPGPRLVQEAFWCGTEDRPRPHVRLTQLWLRRATAPDPSLRYSHGRKEANDAPARLTTDPSCKDEARVGQQGTLTRVWARRGTRPRAPRDRRYAWAYLFGAVCPERAVGAALVLPYADAAATGLHLAEIGHQVAPEAHGVVVLDGAGWHAAGGLAVPGNLTLLPLPRYSPELVWGF